MALARSSPRSPAISSVNSTLSSVDLPTLDTPTGDLGPPLDSSLRSLFALYHAFGQQFQDRLHVSMRPGLPARVSNTALIEGRHPAMALGFGAAPDVLFAWSDRGARESELDALLREAEGLGVREIFLFDPHAKPPAPGLLGYTMEQGQSTAVANREGALESRVLGLRLSAESGRIRARTPDGQPLLFPDELAAELNRWRVEAGRWKERAERKEAELVRLRIEAARQKARADHWKSEAGGQTTGSLPPTKG